MNNKVVIDARMINTSGIGRYLTKLVMALQKEDYKISLLGDQKVIKNNIQLSDHVEILEFNASIYSIAEQLTFITKIPKCDLFISPHYNIPVLNWNIKKQLTFFPDVNHLALGKTLSFIKRFYAKILYNLGAFKSATIVTISDFSRNEILDLVSVKPRKLVVARCGTDSEELMQLAKYKTEKQFLLNNKYILYVGNVKPHKNLYRALLAFQKVRLENKNLKFCIVGRKDGFLTGDKEIYELLESDENLKRAVVFTGYVSDLELVSYYKYAQALLFPSLYEGFGLPPLEAMALECPVITSNGSSMPEVCGEAATYCDPYDINDMAEKITLVCNSEELRSFLKKTGMEKVKEYSWEKFNAIVLHEINELLKV
ncbi:glycosyltransferase family 4 protein [Reichenbachiella sp.]